MRNSPYQLEACFNVGTRTPRGLMPGARTEEQDATKKGKMHSVTISILLMKILKVEKVTNRVFTHFAATTF